jgi:hypothetical protein
MQNLGCDIGSYRPDTRFFCLVIHSETLLSALPTEKVNSEKGKKERVQGTDGASDSIARGKSTDTFS